MRWSRNKTVRRMRRKKWFGAVQSDIFLFTFVLGVFGISRMKKSVFFRGGEERQRNHTADIAYTHTTTTVVPRDIIRYPWHVTAQ